MERFGGARAPVGGRVSPLSAGEWTDLEDQGQGAGHERRNACWGRRAWAGPSLRAKRGTDERIRPRGRSRAEASGGHRLLRYLLAGCSLP